MPARIFAPQLAHFAKTHRVIALDPRSQGESQIAPGGHEPGRRSADIAELLANLGPSTDPVVLVGWSLGVLDSLAYVARNGDQRVAGLVLVDNSVGEDPPPVIRFNIIAALRKDRAGTVRDFVRGMYKTAQTDAYLDELVRTALRTPLGPAIELLSYPVPREYWRDAIYATRKPVLYAVTPRFAGQADNLRKKHTSAQAEVFSGAGHALFVDEPARFNQLMDEFLMRRVWQ